MADFAQRVTYTLILKLDSFHNHCMLMYPTIIKETLQLLSLDYPNPELFEH